MSPTGYKNPKDKPSAQAKQAAKAALKGVRHALAMLLPPNLHPSLQSPATAAAHIRS